MKINKQTILAYNNFKSLSENVLELAKEILPDKVIYINFLNDEVQVTMKVSKHDTKVNVNEGVTIPVESAICNMIDYEKGKPLVLEDIRHNQFSESVNKTIRDLNVGSYLGIPISFKDGTRFGTLCAAHEDKSSFTDKDIHLLNHIAKLFSFYLELEHIALKDALTGLYNTHFLMRYQENIIEDGGLVVLLDLDQFKQVNDTLGHYVGDDVLKELGKKLERSISNFHEAYATRVGGDEFLLYIKDKLKDKEVKIYLDELINVLSSWDTNIEQIPLSASLGALLFEDSSCTNFSNLLRLADDLLYEAKQKGKNQYVLKSFLK